MSYNLFIDEEHNPLDVTWAESVDDVILYRDGGWVIARNLAEVAEIILSLGMPNIVSFDHDLGEGMKTGADITQWMIDLLLDCPDKYKLDHDFYYMVHSKNPIGVENIHSKWASFLKQYEFN